MNVGTGYSIRVMEDEPRFLPVDRPLPTFNICQYVCSVKGDGLRVMFMIYKTGIYMIDRRLEIHKFPGVGLMYQGSLYIPELSESKKNAVPPLCCGTVLDGELTRLHNGEWCLMIFDTLMVCGNECSFLRYDQRMEIGRYVLLELHYPEYKKTLLRQHQELSLPTRVPEACTYTYRLFDAPFSMTSKCIYDMQWLPELDRREHDFPLGWICDDPFISPRYSLSYEYQDHSQV